MGFGTVVGVDTGRELLDELAVLANSREAVRTRHADLVEALPEVAAPGTAAAVVCMRDTLLHLPDLDAVDLLLARVRTSLAAQGALVLTYRDLTTELEGTDRFVPVRSDDNRIMLCAVDYDGPTTVTVTDLVYIRTGKSGSCTRAATPSCASPDDLVERIEDAGLAVTHHTPEPGGMWTTVACPRG